MALVTLDFGQSYTPRQQEMALRQEQHLRKPLTWEETTEALRGSIDRRPARPETGVRRLRRGPQNHTLK